MDRNELLAEARKLIDKAKATVEAGDAAPAEDKAHMEGWLKEAKEFQKQALTLQEIATLGAALAASAQQVPAGNDPAKPGYKRWGDFLYSVWEQETQRKRDPRLTLFRDDAPKSTKDMVENTGASGGFLVPPEFLAQMQSVISEVGVVRPKATIIPMRRREMNIPVLQQTTTTAGVPHWFGGMKVYWTEEAAAKTETTPVFKQATLIAHKLAAITYASDELLDDSAIPLEAFLQGPMGFAGAVGWMEDYAFLRGIGGGQPLGVIPAGCTITQPRAADGTVGYADLVNMLEHFLPSGRGLWVASQSLLSVLLQMNGPAGNASYLWGSAVTGVPNTLLGFPIIFTEKIPTRGEDGDILLADFRYYLIGDRQATTVMADKSNRFEYDETTWRVVHRVDGRPWLDDHLTLADGTSTVSPFVILGAKTGS